MTVVITLFVMSLVCRPIQAASLSSLIRPESPVYATLRQWQSSGHDDRDQLLLLSSKSAKLSKHLQDVRARLVKAADDCGIEVIEVIETPSQVSLLTSIAGTSKSSM